MDQTQSPNGARCFAIFVTNVAQSAANSGIGRVNLDPEAEEQARRYPDELHTKIERAVVEFLTQFSTLHSALQEKALFRPMAVATAIIPAGGFDWVTEALQRRHDLDYHEETPLGLDGGVVIPKDRNYGEEFRQKFVVNTNVPQVQREQPYVACLLKENASDTPIRKELPRLNLSKAEHIASLIIQQPQGVSGFLATNGRANVFYLEGNDGIVYAVRVRWDFRSRAWRIREWPLNKFGFWWADDQIICPGIMAP